MPWKEADAMQTRIQFVQDWLRKKDTVVDLSERWPRKSEHSAKWTLCNDEEGKEPEKAG